MGILFRLLAPKPIRQIRRAAHPVSMMERGVENTVVRAVRAVGGRRLAGSYPSWAGLRASVDRAAPPSLIAESLQLRSQTLGPVRGAFPRTSNAALFRASSFSSRSTWRRSFSFSSSAADCHSVACEWYGRSRRRTVPFSFLGAASYSATSRSLYSGLNERRFGLGAGSDADGVVLVVKVERQRGTWERGCQPGVAEACHHQPYLSGSAGL